MESVVGLDPQESGGEDEMTSSRLRELEVTDYAAVMGIIYSMVKQDYTMQNKIVTSLNLKSSSEELESYSLMWSLRPYVNDQTMKLAWKLVPWNIFVFCKEPENGIYVDPSTALLYAQINHGISIAWDQDMGHKFLAPKKRLFGKTYSGAVFDRIVKYVYMFFWSSYNVSFVYLGSMDNILIKTFFTVQKNSKSIGRMQRCLI